MLKINQVHALVFLIGFRKFILFGLQYYSNTLIFLFTFLLSMTKIKGTDSSSVSAAALLQIFFSFGVFWQSLCMKNEAEIKGEGDNGPNRFLRTSELENSFLIQYFFFSYFTFLYKF